MSGMKKTGGKKRRRKKSEKKDWDLLKPNWISWWIYTKKVLKGFALESLNKNWKKGKISE